MRGGQFLPPCVQRKKNRHTGIRLDPLETAEDDFYRQQVRHTVTGPGTWVHFSGACSGHAP